ncbi:Uronate isomerase [compost metagenome]
MSYSRHEYFRRLLANIFAEDIIKGYLPHDIDMIGKIIADISYHNAAGYFNKQNT